MQRWQWRFFPFVVVAALFLAVGTACAAKETPAKGQSAKEQTVADSGRRHLPLKVGKWQGDFDAMLERRVIRVAVPYSRTLFYVDKGRERGITAENARQFEEYLNKKYKKKLKRRPITVYLITTTRDQLLKSVADGMADIAAGNLTITDKRKEQLDFVQLAAGGVNEVVVTGLNGPKIATVDDLAGKTVHVRPSSSYHESLLELNKRFAREGKGKVKLVLLPDALEDEDILEMLNTGIIEAAVVDDWKARAWEQLLPEINVHEQAIVRSDSQIGWGVRKGSPQLQQEISEFFRRYKGQKLSAVAYRQTAQRVKVLKNNAAAKELKKFEELLALFEKYGHKYNFDPLLLTAMGYQESRLDQKARSRVGAVGVMQLMPATGKSMKVGNIRVTEPNIHAGAKYLDQLIATYFADARFSELDRTLFAFAAYNAGPGRIASMRRIAAERGLDPNVWFNNVEVVTADKVGSETTTYVRNIYKYYAAYKLVKERQEEQERVKKQVGTGK